MRSKPKTKAEAIRALPSDMPSSEVARRVGAKLGVEVQLQEVSKARQRTGARGRPRVHTHPAEACARLVESMLGDNNSASAKRIRNGEWKKYLG